MLTLHKKLMLLDALLESYPDECISGYLLDVRISCGCVQGLIYKAWYFRNGELITSGEIHEIVDYGNRFLIRTVDSQTFVIVSFHPRGGRKSLQHLIQLYQAAQLVHSRWCLQ
ncbi:hypothetical protein D3C78_1141600 [compost metagenome]